MKKGTQSILIGLILLVGLFAAACPKRTSIADIESNPSKFYDKEVAVAGTVKTSYGVSIPIVNESGGIYKVDDGTGAIWVMTKRSVPSKGAQLGIKGKIQNGVNYNGKNYGLVLIEEDRKLRTGNKVKSSKMRKEGIKQCIELSGKMKTYRSFFMKTIIETFDTQYIKLHEKSNELVKSFPKKNFLKARRIERILYDVYLRRIYFAKRGRGRADFWRNNGKTLGRSV